MYAIFESGGHQYSVVEGDVIQVARLETEPGARHEFDKVLVVSGEADPKIGNPYVKGARVLADVISHGRHDKINVFKFKRRTKYRKLTGHRQDFTEVKIGKISLSEPADS